MVSPDTHSVIQRAKQLYADRLQADLERQHLNQFVAIEPDSGEYFLGATFDEAIQAAIDKYPTRLTYLMRIGHRAALHLGGVHL